MITGVVLARNEASNIVACMEAFKPHVDELLLIDMESNDATIELASLWVDRTLTHPQIPNFDAARNLAIDAARFDWLWFCDADERISPLVGETVRDLVRQRGHEFEALSVPFKTYFSGKWIEHCGWWPGYTMPRVLKRGHFRFREELHSGVQVEGREMRVAADPRLGIDHFSYLSVEHYYEKFNTYTSTESQQLSDRGQQWDWRTATQAMVRDLWLYYERNHGQADGAHGWILSWLAGQYRWASHAKLIDNDAHQATANSSYPIDLDVFFEEAQAELARLRNQAVEPPLGVVWRTPVYDPSGYAEEGRTFVKVSADSGRQVTLEPIPWSDQTVELPKRDQALFRALTAARRPVHWLAITNCIPTLAQPTAGAAINVLRTTFETDRLPLDWLPRLEAYDEIWVISRHNYETFVRSGVAPEKLRIVPSTIDEELFRPDGPEMELPSECRDRFVFLSIFDWQLRKGWDVLLKAYVREFSLDDNTALLLKVSRVHGHTKESLRQQAEQALSEAQTSLAHRPDIVFWEEMLDGPRMAALYRSTDAFVLPTRGEGWGRPYMEAMACGLPTIGTAASGNIDFMTAENSLLVPAELQDVSEAAANEIFTFRGHRWHEPDENALRQSMRQLLSDAELREELSDVAAKDIRQRFGSEQTQTNFESAIQAVEQRFQSLNLAEPNAQQIRVEIQGELLAGHSFSNINEALAVELGPDPDIAISLKPRFPLTSERLRQSLAASKLAPFVDRSFADGPQVVIRHAYPPDWSEVSNAKWVHIQPWEFGYLPQDWIAPLRDQVDEIWAPSQYVKQVYEQSGISSKKIHVIPWGVDPAIFNTDAIPRLLPTQKAFRFIYVGGTVARKGFDLLLEAYLAEFSREDDVCLVVKDVGINTVYRYGNYREQVLQAMKQPDAPEIIYFDNEMTPGQLSSLYSACHCLVSPYRGEGFGLPILEAMACGLPPIVPRGGPSDDFVDASCGYVVDSQPQETRHPETLCGPATEIVVEVGDLRAMLRRAKKGQAQTAELGQAAATRVAEKYSWNATADMMKQRLVELTTGDSSDFPDVAEHAGKRAGADDNRLPLTVLLRSGQDAVRLGDALARIEPFVKEILLVQETQDNTIAQTGREYGARVVTANSDSPQMLETRLADEIRQEFWLWLDIAEPPTEQDWKRVRETVSSIAESQYVPGVSTAMALDDGRSWTLHRKSRTAPESKPASPGMEYFRATFQPHLLQRAATFTAMLEYLDEQTDSDRLIVETGCVRMADDWGAGQSTLIFDTYVERSGGRFLSVDNNPRSCEFARRLCNGASTTIVNDHSLNQLRKLAAESPRSIDLLYLDSLDVDWNNPHSSALYHLHELCAAMPALKSGALVIVDDHRNEQGQLGKSMYVADFMKSIAASRAFEAYQIGWIVQ